MLHRLQDFSFCVICLCAKGQIVAAVVQVVWFGEMHQTIRIDFFEAEFSGGKKSSNIEYVEQISKRKTSLVNNVFGRGLICNI